MKDLKDIDYHDAQMYYHGIIALDRKDGTPHQVFVISRDELGRYDAPLKTRCRPSSGRIAVRNWYAGLTNEVGGRTRQIILPETLEKEYSLSKFPLGWLNYPSGAFYLSSTSERTVRKGHRTDRIRVGSVYYQSLHSEYSKLCIKLDRMREQNSDAAYHQVERQLGALHQALRKHRVDANNTSFYIRNVVGTAGNPTFFTVEEAQDMLLVKQPRVHSVALSREFAVSLCSQFHTTSAGLYFHMKMIGYMDREGLHVFKAFGGALPQIKRALGVQGVLA